MTTPKARLKPALNVEIDAGLLDQMTQRAKDRGVRMRLVVEEALALYLRNDGLPPIVAAAVARIEAETAAVAAQIEPIAAFLTTVKYRDSVGSSRGMAPCDRDEWEP